MDLEEAKKLLNAKKYAEAARLLDRLIAIERNNDELRYLRGLVSLKLRNYAGAEEEFEHALWIKQKPEYWRMKAVSYMESCQFEKAIPAFKSSLRLDPRDVDTHIYLALCYLFLNEPAAREYVQRAYLLHKKKTKQLLRNFYAVFFQSHQAINENVKRALEKKLDAIPE